MILIAAMTKDRVIGKNNALPWPPLKEDMKLFREYTSGNTVIMGRKTYESIPEKFRPLPNRHNIVVSTTMQQIEGLDVCRSFEEAISKAQTYGKEIFIIGGARIYEAALPHANRLYLSFVKRDYEGDTYFPEFSTNWGIQETQDFDLFEFRKYVRSTETSE